MFYRFLTLLLMCTFISACHQDNNQPPVFQAQRLAAQFESTSSMQLKASDAEGDVLHFELISAPKQGLLTLSTSGQLSYTPEVNQTNGQQATISVSDGTHSIQQVLTIDIVDNTEFRVVATLPEDRSQRLDLNVDLIVRFNSVLDTKQFDAVSDDPCQHLVRLKLLDSDQCLPLDLNIDKDNPKQLNIINTSALQAHQSYRLELAQQIINFATTPLTESVDTTFETAHRRPIISEVSTSPYSIQPRWVEIYNGTSSSIQLGDYQLQSQAYDFATYQSVDHHLFPLPQRTLASGEYIVIQNKATEQDWQNGFKDSEQLVMLDDKGKRMSWQEQQYVALMHQHKPIDMVQFGEANLPDNLISSWQGKAVQLDSDQAFVTRSFALTDTDTAGDWHGSAFPTAGVNNDVLCQDDDDKDGIPDCNEVEGTTYAGLPLYDWGARIKQADIFIEVDYMQSEDKGIQPQKESLDKVTAVFANRGYALHFDVGERFNTTISPSDYNLGGGQSVPFSLTTYFTETSTQTSVLGFKSQYMHLPRRNIFHYMLFANSQREDGSAGSSGYAEIGGNDSIITLGGWGLDDATTLAKNYLINIQASTIMHEFGHNLGLLHGGSDFSNYKPNFLSSMNYLYQLDGLPTIGQEEGDRLLNYVHTSLVPPPPPPPLALMMSDMAPCLAEQLINGPHQDPKDFKIDYSAGNSIALDELALDESQGFGHLDSQGIDYNCNGYIDDAPVSADLNVNGWVGDLTEDYNEWQHLELRFNKRGQGASSFKRSAILTELGPSERLLTALEQAKL